MANLIGYLDGRRGRISRLGNSRIAATLETWHGAISVDLGRDGSFQVDIGGKGSVGRAVLIGNVDEGHRHAIYVPEPPETLGEQIKAWIDVDCIAEIIINHLEKEGEELTLDNAKTAWLSTIDLISC